MPEDRTTVVDGVRLRVRTWTCPGAARPPVVLLPATGETAEDWDVVAAALQPTRTVHAVDLRGHGDSDRPGTYSIALMADDVTGLLPQLEASPVDLVGHSLGGLVACRAAAAGPERVRRLVLEDVGLLHPRAAAPPPRPEGPLRFDWAIVEQVRPEIDDPAEDWPRVVSALPMPALVVAGGPSSPVPSEHIGELVALLPDGRSVTVDAGHLVHAREPAAFVRQLLGFLDS